MRLLRHSFTVATMVALASWMPLAAHAQLTMVESGFLGTTLSGDLGKQIEVGVGGDTCLYYGTFDGLMRRCAPFDPGTVCDPTLTFPVGIAFSTGGSFDAAIYVADYGIGDVHRSPGCSPFTPFATIATPGALAFPPSGSAYGDFLFTCVAFDGPIYRVSPTGTVTTWLAFPAAYLRFGPGGPWGAELYATEFGLPGTGRIVRISSTGVVTPVATSFGVAEGFDWGFDGDMFATDVSLGQVLRVKSDGTKTLFATLPGAADLAYRAGEQALYVISNQGGLYRITRGGTTDVSDGARAGFALAVSPNPARGACTLRFSLPAGGLTRVQFVDAAGRLVRRLPETWRPAGTQVLAWDGRDDSGSPVRSGMYFARLTAAGEMRNARVMIVR